MIPPKLPKNEKARQKAVEKYKLLDTYPEESYDNITSIIGYITEAPVSLITLLQFTNEIILTLVTFPKSSFPSLCKLFWNLQPIAYTFVR